MPFQPKPLPPAAELWERYSYNPLTGELFSRKRPSSRKPLGRQRDGYIRVHLKWRGIESAAHRVIWKWMTGEDPIDTIDHINRQRADNRFWNLREASPTLQSRNHSRCKLTVDDAASIKRLLADGHGQAEIARHFGVRNTTIHEIAIGRNWVDVSPHPA